MSRPRPPKRLRVGPYRYRIDVTQEALNAAEARERTSLYGCCVPADERITISPRLSVEREQVCLVHEALHALFDLTALDTLLGGDQRDLEEDVIAALSPVLLQLLRDNPKLVAYLTA